MSSSEEQPIAIDSSDGEQEKFVAHKAKKAWKIESDSDTEEKAELDQPNNKSSSDTEKSDLEEISSTKTKKKRKIKRYVVKLGWLILVRCRQFKVKIAFRALLKSSDEDNGSDSETGGSSDSNLSSRSTPQKKSGLINRLASRFFPLSLQYIFNFFRRNQVWNLRQQ
jgi:hypothetical protein